MDQLEDYRERIVHAAFTLAVFEGWTDKTLRKAAQQEAIDADYLSILFPRGVVDALAWHSSRADAAMADYLQSQSFENTPIPLRVKQAVMWRLHEYADQREAIRLALTLLSFPLNASRASRMLYDTVDTIWFGIGDRSTDFNFYTKRMTLATIYSSTLQIWLDDRSDDLNETEAFLDRRLRDVGRFGKCKKQLQETLQGLAPSRRGGSEKAA